MPTPSVRFFLLALLMMVAHVSAADTPGPAVDPKQPAVHTEKNDPLRNHTTAGQRLQPAGESRDTRGRALDLACSPDGSTVFVKTEDGLAVMDSKTWRSRQFLKYEGEAGSWHGLALSADGRRIYVSGKKKSLFTAIVGADGTATWQAPITFGKGLAGTVQPDGIALNPEETRACVCFGLHNTLGVVDLKTRALVREIPVGICPYDVVLSPDGHTAYVSNFGGRRARAGDLTEDSAGTDVPVTEHSLPLSGTVSVVDWEHGREVAQIAVGMHPAGMVLADAGRRLLVANANDDSVSILDPIAHREVQRLNVRPDPELPFGSLANALALSPDGRTLFVANAGNNAVAVCDFTPDNTVVRGFMPTGWYPGGVLCAGKWLFVANVKGGPGGYEGSVNRLPVPDAATLAAETRAVRAAGRIPEAVRALQIGDSGVAVAPVPVPAQPGEPSLLKHVVYIIKENRTYDTVLGDLPRGNRDPKLCVFNRAVTPNHHAIAEEFALLDNYYCNGVLSCDGHGWATQGIVTDYREKDWYPTARTYGFGTDPLCYASGGFLWDAVLLHGLSFRNYGENARAESAAQSTWFDNYRTWRQKQSVPFTRLPLAHTLQPYTSPDYPGWDLKIPDQYRADVFLRELNGFVARGELPNLIVVYLPNDHAAGRNRHAPSVRAYVADNDLALGRIVAGLSRSPFWRDTCVFVNEDDPQDGLDHVDGHRSFCLVASPYARRGQTITNFYNQSGVLHTICRILGCPPPNQTVALSPTMEACFTNQPDLTPYDCRPNQIALDEPNPPPANACAAKFYAQTDQMDFSQPDLASEKQLNRMQWDEAHSGVPYPAEFEGHHGRGLKALGLKAADLDGDTD
jgi:DNA-binding beta-propeller fold protein YncE